MKKCKRCKKLSRKKLCNLLGDYQCFETELEYRLFKRDEMARPPETTGELVDQIAKQWVFLQEVKKEYGRQ